MKNGKSADVVVIGGGAMGSATAFQLAKKGLDVVLCEMRTLASGATGRCGGMVVHCYGRETNIDKTNQRLRFTRANTKMLEEFQQELDIDYEFRHIGCIDIAVSEKEFSDLNDLVKIQKSQGDEEIQLLSKEETLDCMPTLNKKLVFGSRYRPSDGNLAPYKMVHAFARGAQKYGARILTFTKVEEILINDGKVAGVMTNDGPIYAKWVINCTNGWAKYLGKETECILPVREVACVTESIGPVPPQSFEMLLNGEFAYGGTQTATGNLTIGGPAHPREKHLGYYNEVITFDEVQRLAYYVSEVFPSLNNIKLIRAWTGTMAFSPDAMPMIGKSSITENLLIAVGFAAGISQECTVGKILTDIVTTGDVSLDIDMSLYDPGRFLGQTFEWPEPYDLSILHDYLAAKKRHQEKEYKVPYNLVADR